MDSIVLIGFMGAGKTTIGKKLSGEGFLLLDTDECIEKKENMKISDIFAEKGEEYFRNLETKLLEELCKDNRKIVLSCGGGMALRSQNRELLKKIGKVIYLKISSDTVLERLKKDTSRPLLQGEDRMNKVKTLMKQREEFYLQAADYVIKADDKAPSQHAKELLEL